MPDKLSIRVDMAELQELVRKYPEASKKATVGRLTEALEFLEQEIQQTTPVGAGPYHLRESIFHKVEMGGPIWGLVSTPAQYGLPVEMGSKPHWVPIAPLQFWVEKVLHLEGKEAKSVAFAIKQTIKKRGKYGTYMFKYAFERYEGKVKGILGEIPADIVREVEGS